MAPPPIEIDVVEFGRLRRGDVPPAVLDVRESWELALCRFEESINVPLATLPGHAAALPRDRLLVVVCHHGVRSLSAAAWLRANGVERAVSLRGGIDAWARSIDTAMRTY
jgi:rhodanese-related sulfurtransferase